MKDILYVVTVTGIEEAAKAIPQDLRNQGKVVDARVELEKHKLRDQYAMAELAPFENPNVTGEPKALSKARWEQFSWGIHPASLNEDGFSMRLKFTANTSEDDGVNLIKAISTVHPDLYFDTVFVKLDEEVAGILLVHGGEIVLFSVIADQDFEVFRDVHAAIGKAQVHEMDADIVAQKNIMELHFLNGLG